jgi:hypothetical protein
MAFRWENYRRSLTFLSSLRSPCFAVLGGFGTNLADLPAPEWSRPDLVANVSMRFRPHWFPKPSPAPVRTKANRSSRWEDAPFADLIPRRMRQVLAQAVARDRGS